MIVLKSKNPIRWGDNTSHTSIVFMRITTPAPNYILKKVFVNHQYYRMEDGVAKIIEGDNEELTFDQFRGLVQGILTGDKELLNNLDPDLMHRAYYAGALYTIEAKGTYGTVADDWEIIEIPEDDPDYDQHTTQIMQ